MSLQDRNPQDGNLQDSNPRESVLSWWIVGLLACPLILVAACGLLLVLWVRDARSEAKQMRSAGYLKGIILAMHNYHDTYKCFPAAYIADEQGNPRTSWRTMILPFIEQGSLYGQYDFNVAWDAPQNAAAIDVTIDVYQSPSAVTVPGETNYFMITGPGTIGDGQFHTLGQFTDGTANTVLIVEVQGLGIHWAEPRDISLDEFQQMLAFGHAEVAPGGFNAAFADGSVRFIPVTIDPNQLDAMATFAGGEKTPSP